MHAQQHEKIGHLMLWLSQAIPDLYITKLLKLLYLCDETAVRKTGVPITWLTYKVWKYGPVPLLVYDDLNFKEATTFGAYVTSQIARAEWTKEEKPQLKILPIGTLSKELFSLQEVQIINQVLNKYGAKTAKELVKLLHQQDSLWHKLYVKEGLAKRFALPECSTSPYEIDLSELLAGDEQKLAQYDAMEEFQAFIEAF